MDDRAAFPYRTVIDIAAASKDLTRKETVKTILGISGSTDDAVLDILIHQASADIVRFCNREFASEKLTDHFDAGYVADVLFVSRVPVGTVHTIIEAGTTLDAADYEINTRTGEIWRLNSDGARGATWSAAKITVQHTSGIVLLGTIPHDIERQCIEQVKFTYRGRKRDPSIRSESVPDVYEASYVVSGGEGIGESGLLKSVENALWPYHWSSGV